MSSSADLMTKAPGLADIRLDGISHLAVNVADIDAALNFYGDTLGFTHEPAVSLPQCGSHAVVAAASGQRMALCRSNSPRPSPEWGVHNAYRVTADARAAIVDRVARRGDQVFSYREVRPAEAADNCYFYDPFGNRIQLVVTDRPAEGGRAGPTIQGIDHAVIQTIDIEWEEEFYVSRLGLPVDCNIGRRTADYVLAQMWKDGKEDMAPGIMRLDKRYSTIHGTDPVPRPNMQLFVQTGGNVLGIYLTNKPFQEPPEEMVVGTPRTAFRVTRAALAAIAATLEAAKHPTVGPVEHPTASPVRYSLYCKDPGANFIEFCC
jgi:catechol 2,3-dioxygenase-like lactoylglutathione lyase family enzyme